MKINKRNSLVLATVLSLVLAAFSSGDSEAQSAEMPLSELSCLKLDGLQLSKMSIKQRMYAGQCDMQEAAQAWEQAYGGLNHEEMIAAVIYE